MDRCNDRCNAWSTDRLYSNAQMGAMTDVMHNVQMDCTDDAWTGALKGVTYNVLMDG